VVESFSASLDVPSTHLAKSSTPGDCIRRALTAKTDRGKVQDGFRHSHSAKPCDKVRLVRFDRNGRQCDSSGVWRVSTPKLYCQAMVPGSAPKGKSNCRRDPETRVCKTRYRCQSQSPRSGRGNPVGSRSAGRTCRRDV
jgi:hypothetical protein